MLIEVNGAFTRGFLESRPKSVLNICLTRNRSYAWARLVSSGVAALDPLLGDGYPDKSTILVVGPPGIGKEALGYWFTQSGLTQGDFCLYVTRLSVKDVQQDEKGFGIDSQQKVPLWLASNGGQVKYDVNDLAGLSYNIKEILKQNSGRRARVVIDAISSLLMLNPPETIYKFLTQLLADVKQYDAVLLATLEEGMHKPEVLAAMQQLFDGVVELRLYEEGLRVLPLLRIRKMRGVPPQPGYFNFSFTRIGMEISAYGK
jgi:circadian clock protein KaiC